jgi:hypothetical protein
LLYTDPTGRDVLVCTGPADAQDRDCKTLGPGDFNRFQDKYKGHIEFTENGEIFVDGQLYGTYQHVDEMSIESDTGANFALGGLFRSLVFGGANLAEAMVAPNRVIIGKLDDLKVPNALRPGERTIELRNLNDPKLNWAQNSSKLREAMRARKPIRDVSAEPVANGTLANETGFLRAERNLLRNAGWGYKDGYWFPPSK